MGQLTQELIVDLTALTGDNYLTYSDDFGGQLAQVSQVKAYYSSPRIIAVTNQFSDDSNPSLADQQVAIDILQDAIRSYASPGQSKDAESAFQGAKGESDSNIEGVVLNQLAASDGGEATSSVDIFDASLNAGAYV